MGQFCLKSVGVLFCQKLFTDLIKNSEKLTEFSWGPFLPNVSVLGTMKTKVDCSCHWPHHGQVVQKTTASRHLSPGPHQEAQCWLTQAQAALRLLHFLKLAFLISQLSKCIQNSHKRFFFPSLVYFQRWKSLNYKILQCLNKSQHGRIWWKIMEVYKNPSTEWRIPKGICLV